MMHIRTLTSTALALLALAFCAPAAAQAPLPQMTEAWIPLPDGTRLAADLFMPADMDPQQPLPVLLEYLPYRKHESRARSADLYSYFVARGYVVARVDIRGTGASEGRLIPHEYSDVELDDGEEVIAWLAGQPWSNGKVGMFGISWGGFNSIQMAVRAPPALKAFIAVMATEDLYQDDVHYMDGIFHMDSWMMSHDLYNALPGAPDYVLDEAWLHNRFETEPSVFTYLRQQRDGPFWDRASARDKYDANQGARLPHRRLVRRLPRQRARAWSKTSTRRLKAWLAPGTTSGRTMPGRANPSNGAPRRCAGLITG